MKNYLSLFQKLLFAFLLTFVSVSAWGQTTVFSDDFSANQSTAYTTSGAINTSSWSVNRSGADWGARINTSPAQLELTNDVGSTSNVLGWAFANTSLSSFSSPYSTTLSSNTGLITWTFNFRTNRTSSLSGFANTNNYGMAMILASSSSSPNTSGTGYAVVMGGGTSNNIALIKFNNGLQGTRTTIIGYGNTPTNLTDYISIKVTYLPSTNTWSLYSRDDGTSAFSDPSSGTLTQIGSGTIDSTYTGTAMSYLGAYWQGSTMASQIAFFDNVKVTVTPATCTAPTTQASGITLSSSATSSLNIGWTNGSGSSRVVFVAQTTTGTPAPVDNTTYTANTTFGSGSQIGSTGWYCVYNGTGNSVTVSGLDNTKNYKIMVVEYNCTAGSEKYITSTNTNNPADSPVSTLAGSITTAGNVSAGTTNHILASYNLTLSSSSTTITQFSHTLDGTYTSSDIATSGLKLWTNTTNDFASATLLSSISSGSSGSGEFPTWSVSQALASGSTRYFWLTADINASATNGHTIRASVTATDFTYSNFVKQSGSIAIGGMQTITGSVNTDWCNLQYPATQTIEEGSSFQVYAQAYKSGLTEAAGQASGLSAWIGYSTTNNNPSSSGWTWIPATFNTQVGNNDEFVATLGSGLTPGTYYYASRFQIGTGTYTYGGTGGVWSNDNGVLTVNSNKVDYGNIQYPASGTITVGSAFTVYAQVYEPGITNAVGQGAGITSWIGYSTTNNNPSSSGWTWVSATYNTDSGNNDEYMAEIGSPLSAGTYYYASRFQKTGSTEYYYGGYSSGGGGLWNGTSNVSGTLTVNPAVPVVTGTSLTATYNAAYTYTITATNSPTSYTLASGTLPSGISLNTTTGVISGTPTVLGVFTFGITATNAGGTSTEAPFTLTVTTYTNGDYRTTDSGNWVSNNALPAIWQQFDGANWNTSNSPNYSTTNNVYIMEGHSVTATGSFGNSVNLNIKGTLTISTSSTSASIHVFENGILNINGTLTNTGNFIVDDNGTVNLNSRANNIWNGTEQFAGNSNFNVLYGYVSELLFSSESVITTNTTTNAKFGYLNIIPTTFNTTGNWTGILPSGTYKLTNNDLKVENSTTRNFTFNGGNITVGRDFIINITNTGDVATQSVTGDNSLTILRNFEKNGSGTGKFRTNGSGTYIVNINGDLNINAGTFSNTGASAASTISTINLQGNLFVAAGAILTSNNTSSSYTSNNIINFNGSGSPQNINVINSSTASYNIFNANAGSYVKIINQDFALGTNSAFNVKSGATLDFGFNSTTGLNLSRASSQLGQAFNAQSGSTLKITSADGISNGTSVYTGNVQIGADATKRIFDAGATYHYIGKSNQISGNGLPASLSNKVIVELDTDALTFQPSGSNTFASAGTLEIRKGIVLDNSTGSFKDATSASANLTMTGGRFRLFRTGTMPDLSGTYNLTGGVVEFANTQTTTETVRNKTYQNIEVTGTNVGNSNGNITLNDNGTFVVKNGGIFTINDNSIIGPSGTQTVTVENGGTFRTGDAEGFYGSTSSVKNDIETVNLQDGSIVEYTRADNQVITDFNPLLSDNSNQSTGGYYNLKISGDNTTNSTAKTLSGTAAYVRNNLEITTPSILKIEENKNMVINKNITSSGSSNFIMNHDGNLLQINESAVNTGDMTAHRNATVPVNSTNQYVYWSSPVVGQNFKNIFPGYSTTALYYNESTDYFGTSSGSYILGRSLAVRNPVTASGTASTLGAEFKGVPYNGAFSYSLAFSNASHGYNLVGNPYPSNLNLDTVYSNSTNVDSTFKFWDNTANSLNSQQGSSYHGYGYATYNAVSHTGSNATGSTGNTNGDPGSSSGSKTPNYILKVGQGFIARATSSGAQLSFNNLQRISTQSGSNFFGKTSASETDRYWLQMVTPSGLVITNAVVYFEQGNKGYTLDDSKQEGDASDALYTYAGETKVIINGRSSFAKDDVINLGNRYFQNGIYTIKLKDKEGVFADGQSIYLRDRVLNILTDLTKGDYVYSSGSGEFTDRFEIVYEPDSVLGTGGSSIVTGLQIYRDGDDFVVRSPQKDILEVELYDASGKLVYKQKSESKEERIPSVSFITGMYVLKARFTDGSHAVKKMRK